MSKQPRKSRRDPLETVDLVPDILADREQTAPQPSRQTKPARRDRSWDARRSKATYDLPAELIDRIRSIAGELGEGPAKVKVSDVARLLLEAGLEQYEAGNLAVEPRPTGYTLFDD